MTRARLTACILGVPFVLIGAAVGWCFWAFADGYWWAYSEARSSHED